MKKAKVKVARAKTRVLTRAEAAPQRLGVLRLNVEILMPVPKEADLVSEQMREARVAFFEMYPELYRHVIGWEWCPIEQLRKEKVNGNGPV